MGARSLKSGCFLGAYLPGKVPKTVLVNVKEGGNWTQRRVKVKHITAPTYAEAWKAAESARIPQWIWVKDGVPGESR